MTETKHMTCPQCERSFAFEGAEFTPFCSSKCKLLDLNAWFSHEYSLPAPITERNFDDFERELSEHMRDLRNKPR